jgi:hypothetical protein
VLGLVAAGVVVGPTGPASAVAAADGYVWANQPGTASYLADTGYEYNSTGGAIEVIRDATGRYRVRFSGMATAGGIAHVTAHGTGAGFCAVASWGPSGTDLTLNVRCFGEGGAAADLPFLAHFTNRHPAGTFAYLWSNQASPAGAYSPSASYRYDSTGVVPSVERVATGQYLVYLGAVDDVYPDYDLGRFQVTAYGTAAVHCEQGTVNDELPAPITVRCYDADGDPTDSRFSLSYGWDVTALGGDGPGAIAWVVHTTSPRDPTYHWLVDGWSSPGSQPTVARLDTGVFLVRLPGFSGEHGYPTAGAYTNGPGMCHVVGAGAFGADESIIVACRDGVAHEPADLPFTVAFLP